MSAELEKETFLSDFSNRFPMQQACQLKISKAQISKIVLNSKTVYQAMDETVY